MTTSCPWIGTGYFNPPGSSGSGTNGIIAQRYNIAELETVDPSAIASGTMTFVATVRDSYYYDASSTLNADGITVIAPNTGSGRWIRMNLGNETWRRQATWFIDPSSAGDDEADGSTIETAIQTHAELRRRWGPGRALLQPPGDTVEITILGDLPAEDPIEFDLEVHGNTLVRYRGATTPAQIFPYEVDNLDPASQTPTTILTETDLTSYVGERLRIVTASGDAYAWILATGVGVAAPTTVISAPALVDLDAVPFQAMPAIVEVSPSDGFYVDALTSANLGPVRGVRVVTSFPPTPAVVFQDLRLGGPGGVEIPSVDLAYSVTGVDFAGCQLSDLLLFGAQTEITSCRLSTMGMVSGLFNLHACVGVDGVQILDANVTLDSQNVWYGITMSLEASTVNLQNPNMGTEPALSVFDVSDGKNGIEVDATSTVVTDTLVWGELGSGSQHGWYVSPGGRVFYDLGVLPTLSGAAGDVVVGGVERYYSMSPDLPFFNIDNGAAFVER